MLAAERGGIMMLAQMAMLRALNHDKPPPSSGTAPEAREVIQDRQMSNVNEQPLTKIAVARAQLITALDLFVRDKDPISVQCLACGGGEVIEGLAETHGEEVFATHIMKTQPDMDRAAIRRLRNQYWNAFKHFFDLKQRPRDDEELLRQFNDTKNDVALYVGWSDYAVYQKKMPAAAQVFQVWWYALNEEKLSPTADLSVVRTAFPDIRQQDRPEQKRRLRRSVEKYRKDKKLLADPATERGSRSAFDHWSFQR